MLNLLFKNYTETEFLANYGLMNGDKDILNAGSSSLRYVGNCLNVDIQCKPNVDVVCDVHELSFSSNHFDAIVCNAVLQYCMSPQTVANEFHRVLKAGGYLFLDAPWVQPYCPDTPDKFRFSEDALRSLFENFQIIEIRPSIRPGSAFAMLGVHIAGSLTTNKYLNFVFRKICALVLWPFRRIRTVEENKTAGAFYIICKKIA